MREVIRGSSVAIRWSRSALELSSSGTVSSLSSVRSAIACSWSRWPDEGGI
jgi:hypothetical protein